MTSQEQTRFTDEYAAWHAGIETARTAPFGPLSATALHWIPQDPAELPGLPGTWSRNADGLVTVELNASDGVTQGGKPVSGSVELGPLKGLERTALGWGDIQLEIAARSGGVIVRPRDPNSPTRTRYSGTRTFPARMEWVLAAEFVPTPRDDVEVESAAGPGITQRYDSPGSAKFSIDGQEYSLTLFGSTEKDDLRAVFSDDTGADLTFSASRTVMLDIEDDGSLILDFNRATNPPCAYTENSTCPLPPPENRLPLRIEAGELRPD